MALRATATFRFQKEHLSIFHPRRVGIAAYLLLRPHFVDASTRLMCPCMSSRLTGHELFYGFTGRTHAGYLPPRMRSHTSVSHFTVVALEVCPPAADCSRDARPPCAGHELWGARGCAGAQPYTGPGPRGPGPWAWASACSAGPVPRGRALTPRPGPGLGPRARAAGRGPRRAPGPGGDDASNSRSFLCRPLLQALRLARGVEPQRGPAPRPRAHDWYIEHIWGSRDGAAHRFASWSAPGKPSCAIPHQHPSVHLNLVPNVVFVRRRPAAVRKHSMHDHQVGAIQMHASTF